MDLTEPDGAPPPLSAMQLQDRGGVGSHAAGEEEEEEKWRRRRAGAKVTASVQLPLTSAAHASQASGL